MRERRRDYEMMYIISPLRTGEEEIGATIDRVSQAITSLGGEVTATNHSAPWGRRKFAYPIREYAEGEASRRMFTEGYYVLAHFSLGTNQIPELERTLKLTDAVLRYMLTLVDARAVPPAAPVAAPLPTEAVAPVAAPAAAAPAAAAPAAAAPAAVADEEGEEDEEDAADDDADDAAEDDAAEDDAAEDDADDAAEDDEDKTEDK
jgi:small subunit ribosomal protein S6